MSTESPPMPQRRIDRLSGPAELIQAVPYLLGFHPARSVVLVGLDSMVLVVTARLDLDDVGPGVLGHSLGALARGGATSLIVVVYDDAASATSRELPHQLLVELLHAAAEDVGCALLEIVLVAGGRWWPLTCDRYCNCPPEGRELLTEPTAFAAAATVDGVIALPDRAALAAILEPLAEDDRDRLHVRIELAEHGAVQAVLDGHAGRHAKHATRALFALARNSRRIGWTGPADEDVARFGVALTSNVVRDRIWLAVDDGRLDGRPLWCDLARRLPTPYDAVPLFVFGWASWRAGSGALAGIAAERALQSDPDCTVADLLLTAVETGLNPRQVPKLSNGMRTRP